MKPRSLIIGYGSIGTRHATVLAALGHEVAVVTKRTEVANSFRNVEQALATFRPDHVVIANESGLHFRSLAELAALDFRGTVLVEKPLFAAAQPLPANRFSFVGVGYQLRFHPLIARAREVLANRKLFSVHAYVGQDLSTWRIGADYRSNYSADSTRGGGVLRDLSHELDYLTWLTGSWTDLTAQGGTFGSLGIASDDVYSLLWKSDRCPSVSLEVNYLDRIRQRHLTVHAEGASIRLDFIANSLQIDATTEIMVTDRDASFTAMHRAVVAGDSSIICSASEGLAIVNMIEAAERANREKVWVKNEGQ